MVVDFIFVILGVVIMWILGYFNLLIVLTLLWLEASIVVLRKRVWDCIIKDFIKGYEHFRGIFMDIYNNGSYFVVMLFKYFICFIIMTICFVLRVFRIFIIVLGYVSVYFFNKTFLSELLVRSLPLKIICLVEYLRTKRSKLEPHNYDEYKD